MVTLLAAACERREPAPAAAALAPAAPTEAVARPWRTIDNSPQLALAPAESGDPALVAALARAIARARATAPDARARWRDTPPDRRGAWAVKWRAATADDGFEHVWVEPLAWSRSRVEGRLASPPQRELACGKGQNDLVGFPIEEFVDWVHYEHDDFTGAREGGLTIDALEERFGPPGS
jgi:uncharacterized protein YegJ (DUF2314 family)